MKLYHINPRQGISAFAEYPVLPPVKEDGTFFWLDIPYTEYEENFDLCMEKIEGLCGKTVDRSHLFTLINNTHNSYFENTSTFDLLFLRILDYPDTWPTEPLAFSQKLLSSDHEGVPVSFVCFLSFSGLVVTIHPSLSTCMQDFAYLLESFTNPDLQQVDMNFREASKIHTSGLFRLPTTIDEFRSFLLSALINRYQTIRLPLTLILDEQQRNLLMTYQPTFGWKSMLEARITLRYIESICEEQINCLEDVLSLSPHQVSGVSHIKIPTQGASRIIDHIERILNHARRMESAIETVVQIHFSATSNHTNEIMRVMTVVMVLFLPLTVLSGLFGMNFEMMPLVKNPHGFWYIILVVSTVFFGFFFWYFGKKLRPRKPKLDFSLLHKKLKRLRAGYSSHRHDLE